MKQVSREKKLVEHIGRPSSAQRLGVRNPQLQPLIIWRDVKFHIRRLTGWSQEHLKCVTQFPHPAG